MRPPGISRAVTVLAAALCAACTTTYGPGEVDEPQEKAETSCMEDSSQPGCAIENPVCEGAGGYLCDP